MKNTQEIEELDILECAYGPLEYAYVLQDYTAGAIDALLWVLGRVSPVSEELNHEE